MKTILINRFDVKLNYALGDAYIKFPCGKTLNIGKSLERGWRDNLRRVSCIPEGTYVIKLEYSNRFKRKLWEIYGVENRSECKMHAANFWKQLNGCIALGSKHRDINRDGDPDVTSSRKQMAKFHKLMGDDTEAVIIIKNL